MPTYTYYEMTDSISPSSIGCSIESGKVVRNLLVGTGPYNGPGSFGPPNPLTPSDVLPVITDILGTTSSSQPSWFNPALLPTTVGGPIPRSLPLQDAQLNYYYAATIQGFKGIGQPTKNHNAAVTPNNPLTAATQPFFAMYPNWQVTVEFMPRTFPILANESIWYDAPVAADGSRGLYYDVNGNAYSSNDFAAEWIRYTDFDIIPKDDNVIAQQGQMKFRNNNGDLFQVPGTSGGNGAGATATAALTGTSVTVPGGITIGLPGAGYTSPPAVRITPASSGPGSGATAQATVGANGQITAITVITGGSGYTTPPIVTIGPAYTPLIFQDSPRLFLPNQILKFNWYAVPYRFITDPNSYITRMLGRINQMSWYNWQPGQLLYLGFNPKKFTPPVVQTRLFQAPPGGSNNPVALPDLLCNIEFTFLLTYRVGTGDIGPFPNPNNKNWIAVGHNLQPWYGDRAFHYSSSDANFYGVQQGISGQYPKWLSAPFALLFQDPTYTRFPF
jgi:hypothetical protein